MKHSILFLAILWLTPFYNLAQETILPKWLTESEREEVPFYTHPQSNRGITDLPQGSEIRTPGEWEEMQAVVISWTSFPSIHRQLVSHIQKECEVWIVTPDSNSVKNNITSNGGNLTNVKFIHAPVNSIWVRDYGPNSVYLAGVDSLVLVDWIYNRPRLADNAVPDSVGNQMGIPVYSSSLAPNDLVHTGGNFMADGFGIGFSSLLVDDENDGSDFSQQAKTSAEVDELMRKYMGIDTYIKMPTLPYDDIHHIDMHMKLLDEETLLIGEFPQGVSDGPQLELNIQYIRDNYLSVFGTPYKIIRIPMVPSNNGNYPSGSWGEPYYRTYANNLIVNKTVIVPVYRAQFDTTGLRIIRDAMPGYNVVGIDVDNSGANLIAQGGAIHCITKEIAVNDPLLISHQKLVDTFDDLNPYQVQALIKHKSGIQSAHLFYKLSEAAPYTSIPMTNLASDTWSALIPAQPVGTEIFYYIEAQSISGKTQVRPIVAPDGYFHFNVLGETTAGLFDSSPSPFQPLFPNPSKGLTCIPMDNAHSFTGKLYLIDQIGREVETIHEGEFKAGERKYFIDVTNYPSGIYTVILDSKQGVFTQKLAVQ